MRISTERATIGAATAVSSCATVNAFSAGEAAITVRPARRPAGQLHERLIATCRSGASTRRHWSCTHPEGTTLAKSIKTTAVFLKPFRLDSFDEVLPAGEYLIETQLLDPVDWIDPGDWTASVLVHLQPHASHPGLSRTLTVPLTELERAVAEHKLSGKALLEFFLEEMLADPMICLVMQADGVTEDEFRACHSGLVNMRPAHRNAAFSGQRNGGRPSGGLK
jgi:hypothetical protein